ncbi:hypothetical protein HK102_010462 [Quaeritorhiza haematococci]|nr:hypothetical protein HK102_010462 [Quaeritorhiza haematococci]
MKYLLISACAFATGAAAATWTPPSQDAQFYDVEFEETFEGNALNRDRWFVAHDCWGGGNREAQCYIDQEGLTFRVNNGLTIQALSANGTSQADALNGKPCTEAATDLPPEVQAVRCGPNFESPGLLWSAKLRSKVGISPMLPDGRQGRVEIDAIMPDVATGDHSWPFPALWMLPFSNSSNPLNANDWPGRGEIDIAEGIENSGLISSATHFRNKEGIHNLLGGTGGSGRIVTRLNRGDRHVYAVTWSGFDIVYSIDDQETGRHNIQDLGSVQGFFFQPGEWQVILNYAIQRDQGQNALAQLAQSTPLEVKSVRFLREKTASLPPLPNQGDGVNLRDDTRWSVCVERSGQAVSLTPPEGTCPVAFNKVELL